MWRRIFFLTAISMIFGVPAWAKELPVPFTAQAPYGDWRQPWQDACEETVIAMVDFYYREFTDRRIPADQGAKAIQHAYRLKTNTFGWSLDEDANKIAALINSYYAWEAVAVENPTVDDIKKEIDEGRPVILPAYGRALRNPYFRAGGPDYHTVVISGYDDEQKMFITQEPGTRYGLDFRYSYDRLTDAMHDFVPGKQTQTGRRVAIFTRPDLLESALTDGDADGLAKAEEIRHGTILWLKDSDGDGYLDGEEVQAGYMPTLAERLLPNGALVQAPPGRTVYYLENGEKRIIQDEKSFLAQGFRWSDILVVSSKFLTTLRDGLAIN